MGYLDTNIRKHDAAYYDRIDIAVASKRCPACQETKVLRLFSRNARFTDGFCVYCKDCAKLRRNRSADNAASKRWRRSNPQQQMLSKARASAAKRGIPCTITLSDIEIPTYCPVLGIPLIDTTGTGRRVDGTMSIDRIDNAKGYEPGNVLIVSWKANRIKNDASLTDLARILAFYSGAA